MFTEERLSKGGQKKTKQYIGIKYFYLNTFYGFEYKKKLHKQIIGSNVHKKKSRSRKGVCFINLL